MRLCKFYHLTLEFFAALRMTVLYCARLAGDSRQGRWGKVKILFSNAYIGPYKNGRTHRCARFAKTKPGYAFFFAVTARITNRVASMRTMAIGSEIYHLGTNPAIM